MKKSVVLNGDVRALDEILLKDFMGGFSFGAGLFETLLMDKGIPLMLDRHLKRLAASLRLLDGHIAPPPAELLEPKIILHMIGKALAADAELGSLFSGVAKIIVSDGQLLILFRDLPPNYQARLIEGIKLDHAQNHIYRKGDLTINHKLLNYFRQFMHMKQPVLFVNEYEEICETPTANIVLDVNGQLITPPLDAPCLPRTIRNALLSENMMPSLQEEPLRITDLDKVQGGFVTNSVSIAIPITSLLGKPMVTSCSLAESARNFIKEKYLSPRL